jgi:UDP-N-acetylmuramoyl-L-alanyl-D-glutamate--2,6-diaminopimelate ligase
VTTPEAPVVQRYLRRMADAGLTHVILEATSHALAQSRVAAVAFDVAVVTNITHEHLDYHGSYEAYFAAKRRLFEALLDDPLREPPAALKAAQPRTAVLNRDDASYAPLAAFLARQPVAVCRYALTGEGDGTLPDIPPDAWAEEVAYGPDETRLTLRLAGQPPLPLASVLVGEFNVANMLAAAATAAALGIGPQAIGVGLAAVRGLSGRMERISAGQPFLVVVDFAHTPNALDRAIAAARRMVTPSPLPPPKGRGDALSPPDRLLEGGGTGGRVITLFGSAGKRDVAKRRLMAEISARAADLTILTAEDPRTESLDDILAMMAEAAAAAGGREGETLWRVPDRGRAIYFALTLARPGDVVLLCGKGHEQSMAFGATEYPWDDRRAAQAALEAFLAGRPMVDLGLPTF